VGRDSNWATDTGDLRIYVPDSPSYPRDNWRNGAGPRADIAPRAAVVMEGEYRNLRWKGNYWVMTSRDHKPHGSMCLGSRPTLYTAADDSYDYGIFDVTFNAAENSFTGTRQWQCRYPDGRTRFRSNRKLLGHPVGHRRSDAAYAGGSHSPDCPQPGLCRFA
jgi:hypothetical protein